MFDALLTRSSCRATHNVLARSFSDKSLTKLNVVFEDEHYFFVNKSAGIVVAGADPKDGVFSFHDMVKQHALKHYNHWPSLLHRLDKETSGIMVYAKHKLAAKHFLALQEKKGAITKEYLAVVRGPLPEDKGVISGGIIRSKDNLTFTVVKNRKAGKPVKTAYWRLGSTSEYSKLGETVTGVRLALGTGRQHQVRASLRALGCSIIGDTRYGGPKWKIIDEPPRQTRRKNSSGLLLHAHRVSFQGIPPQSLLMERRRQTRAEAAKTKNKKNKKAGSSGRESEETPSAPPTVTSSSPIQYEVECSPPPSWGGLAGLVWSRRAVPNATTTTAVQPNFVADASIVGDCPVDPSSVQKEVPLGVPVRVE